jgi:hypothetical protein
MEKLIVFRDFIYKNQWVGGIKEINANGCSTLNQNNLFRLQIYGILFILKDREFSPLQNHTKNIKIGSILDEL